MSGISEFFSDGSVMSGLGNASKALDLVVPGLGTVASGILGGIGSRQASEYEKQEQIDTEKRAEERAISAEQRANAEYDRRMADERAYNDPSAQAQRMRDAGINPLANLGTTTSANMSSMTAPSQSSVPSPTGPSSRMSPTSSPSITEGTQAAKQYEEGEKLFMENCWERFTSGDRGNVASVSQNYEIRYNAIIDDDGNIELQFIPEGKRPKMEVDCEKHVYHSRRYGDFAIYENGWDVQRLKEEYTSLVGGNEEVAERLAQSWVNLYFGAVEAMSSGKNADANKLRSLADMMASQYLYGDEITGKYILDQIFRAVGAGVDVYTAGKNVAKGKTKK